MERAPHRARADRACRGLGGMAEQTLPDFCPRDSLRPGLANLNLVLKVVEAKEVLVRSTPTVRAPRSWSAWWGTRPGPSS